MNNNAEQIFGLLSALSFILMVAMWFITKTPSHKKKKP